MIVSLGAVSAGCTVGRAQSSTCLLPGLWSLVFVWWDLKDFSELVLLFLAFSGSEVLPIRNLGQSAQDFSLPGG